jgi:hypothetical protein
VLIVVSTPTPSTASFTVATAASLDWGGRDGELRAQGGGVRLCDSRHDYLLTGNRAESYGGCGLTLLVREH